MPMLPTPEAGSRFSSVLGSSPPTMREFHTDFVAHKIAFMVLSDAFLSSSPTIKFLKKGDESKIGNDQLHNTYHKAIAKP
jgi:hypothetical protein